MIVVADTTPVHYLILIGKETILRDLFAEVIIPDIVLLEMDHSRAPAKVRRWVAAKPDWVVVRTASDPLTGTITGLGKGETSAIAIAIEERADALLMDDRRAIREANKNGVRTLTTFALLELAAIRGLVDFSTAIDELSRTNFHLPPKEIVDEYLRRNTRP